MKQNRDRKNFIIIALIISIITMSIGYATLAQNLNIIGTADIKDASWNVKITDIHLITAQSNGVTEVTTPTLEDDGGTASQIEGTTARFNVNLAYPGAKAVYSVTISNNGSIDAILKSITDLTTINQSEPSVLTFSVTGQSINDRLTAKSTHTYTVIVDWVASDDPNNPDVIPSVTSKNATITFNYEQA